MKTRRCVAFFSLLFLTALVVILYFVPTGLSQKSGTEKSIEYNSEGQLVDVENTYDNGRLIERKEFDIKPRTLRRKITYKYLKGFKEPDTSTTNYGLDGKTAKDTTNVDHDKDGNITRTVTTNYDSAGKETGGSKQERDSTGKKSCYDWNAAKQTYDEVQCPFVSEVSMDTPTPINKNARIETFGGLQTAIFDTPTGTIRVNLPDDIMAGDTISGTVVAEPKGKTDEERAKNLAELRGYVIGVSPPQAETASRWTAIADATLPVSNSGNPNSSYRIRLVGSRDQGPSPLQLILTKRTSSISAPGIASTPGPILTVTTVPTVEMHGTTPLTSFHPPTIGQQGRVIEIIGPFDGNIVNTRLMYGPAGSSIQDFEKNTENVSGGFGLIRPLAESPRKSVVEAPSAVTGPIQLFVKDGKMNTVAPYRNVGVNLSAPKTNLIRGEHTTLTIQVNGLQGIDKPVPLTLESNGVITMEGGMYQPLFIQPSQIGADGRYTTTRGITGVQTGGWTSTATVVTQPFNIVLRDPDPPQTILVNSFTGDYAFCGSGPKLTGIGQIRRQGCMFTLTDDRIDRRVNGTFDGCTPVDNGKFWSFYSAGASTDVRVTVTDTTPKKTRVYFNPLGKPAPPIQDVSAFATCP